MPNASDFNRFAVNPVNVDISRSMFNMDHSVKFSCNVGEVIPFDCMEVLPGDTFEIDTSKVIRLQPLVAPIMDEVILDTYWFFVPNRLTWIHWQEFMGENTSSAWTPQVEYNIPTITPPLTDKTISGTTFTNVYGWNVGTIADYLGIPVGIEVDGISSEENHFPVSALPFRAYALICDQWFRSEAIMDPVHVHIDDTNRNGVNTGDQVTDIELGGKPFIACKFFDYFTGALPSPQRGNSVSVPIVNAGNEYMQVLPYNSKPGLDIGDTVPASNRYDIKFGYTNASSNYQLKSMSYPHHTIITDTGNFKVLNANSSEAFTANEILLPTNLYAKLPDINSVTINDLRMAFAIQKYLEKQARYGGRYQEFIKAFFNVDSPDARLQRTEYLGGSRVSLNINQVEQTSATMETGTPLGDVAGMSVTADSHSDFSKSFTEHGFLIGCAVVRYHHSYQDSTHKMWMRKTPYEFYNPVFANIGEVPVYRRELYGYDLISQRSNSEARAKTVFGYQEAWAEYRYMPSRVAGELRSIYQTPLDMWHLGDHYEGLPSLSPEWLREDKSNLDRCLAVTSDVSNQVICDFFIQTKAVRPMPLYSIPGLIDHH